MAIPNKNNGKGSNYGGQLHTEREVQTEYGLSRAAFANQPNQTDWLFEGLQAGGEPARQCTASESSYRICSECGERVYVLRSTDPCPECGAPAGALDNIRCTEIAVPGYGTCVKHGGGHKLTAANRAAMIRGSTTTGTRFSQILYCPCNMFKDGCRDKNLYFDDEGNGRCYQEKLLFDCITKHFIDTYDLDEVADAIILQRLAMTLVRTMRNEKWVSQRGEIVERVRTSSDGTVEQWFESNAANAVIAKLDAQLLAWLKSLNVNKASRDAVQRSAGIGDLARLLSASNTSSEQIIDLDADDDD